MCLLVLLRLAISPATLASQPPCQLTCQTEGKSICREDEGPIATGAIHWHDALDPRSMAV